MATRPSMSRRDITIWLLFFLAAPFVGGLGLMLLVMFVHDLWWPAVPEIGYWPAVVLFVFLRITVGWTRNYKNG